MVVPKAKLLKRATQLFKRIDLPVIQLGFQRPEKAFDPSIHPRTPFYDSLMPDPQEPEAEPKEPGSENGFIVRAKEFGHSVFFDGIEQMTEQGDTGLVPQGTETQTGPRPVLDQTKDIVYPA